MSQWRVKCAKLTQQVKDNSEVLLDLSKMVYGSAESIFQDATFLTEDEARELHNQYASLSDQLDQIVPTINRIARVARGLKWKRIGKTSQGSA